MVYKKLIYIIIGTLLALFLMAGFSAYAQFNVFQAEQGGTSTSTAPTADQILIGGDSAGDYDVKKLEAGTNITIATSSGSVTISADIPADEGNWTFETTYGELSLTPTTTIPVWLKDSLYASSTSFFDGLITVLGNLVFGTGTTLTINGDTFSDLTARGLTEESNALGIRGDCGVDEVVKWNGSNWICATDVLGGGTDSDGDWATSTDALRLYPDDTTDVVLIGTSATTSTGYIFEVSGESLLNGFVSNASSTVDGALTSTGEVTGSFFTASDSNATSTFPNVDLTQILISDDYIQDFAGTGLSVTGGVLNAEVQSSDLDNYFLLTDWFATTTHTLISSLPSLTITESQISDLDHYTTQDFSTDLAGTTTDALSEGSTNKYYSTELFSTDLAGTTTDALSEGSTNLYYTDARVDARINASSTIWNNNTEASLEAFLTDVTNVFTNNDTIDISDNTNLAVMYPVLLTDDTVSLAFGTTTDNNWSGHNIFDSWFGTLASSTHATSTNLDITSLLTFDGVTGSAWSDFCTSITGGAGLCDGTDDGAGDPFAWTTETNYNETVNSTSTPIWFKDSIYASSTSFFDGLLTFKNATGTQLTLTDLWLGGSQTTDLDGDGLSYSGTQLIADLGTDIDISEVTFDPILETELDTEGELETQLTDVTNVFTNNDGALADDDITDDYLAALIDVATTGVAISDILMWDGTNWVDTSTSTLLTELELDTEAELEAQLTDVSDVFTNNDGALNDDNLADDPLDALQNVAAMTEAEGDILYYTGGAWNRLASSSDGLVLELNNGYPSWQTDDNTGSAFAWTPDGTANATSTTLYFGNGYVSQASTTITASTTISGILTTLSGIFGDVTGNLTGNADTATALQANGTNCDAGNAAGGVDASGNAEDCTDYWTEAENTAAGYSVFAWTPDLTYNEAVVSTSTPLWLKDTLYASSTSFFDGLLTFQNATGTQLTLTDIFLGGDQINEFAGTGLTVTGNALTVDLGTSIDISDETNLAATWPVLLTDDTLSWGGLATTSNPTAGNIFYSDGTNGLIPIATSSINVGTASALLANGANCASGNAPLGVDASGAVEDCFDVWTEAENTAAGYLSTVDISDDTNLAATWPVVLTNDTLTFDGLSTSTAAVIGNVPYFSGPNTFDNVATTSLSSGSGITFTGTAGALLGGSNLSISLDATGDWTGTFDGLEGTSYLDGLHIDGTGFVYPKDGDYHSAPYYAATSTTATSTFLGAVGIGTTTPLVDPLTIQPTIDQTGLRFDSYTNLESAIAWYENNVAEALVSYDAGNNQFRQSVIAGSKFDWQVGGGTKLTLASTGFLGVATTAPGTLLSVQGVANFDTATSTFESSGGLNITGGCFAINGTCVGGGGGGTPGGADTQVQYNNGGAFGGADLYYINGTDSWGFGTSSPVTGYVAVSGKGLFVEQKASSSVSGAGTFDYSTTNGWTGIMTGNATIGIAGVQVGQAVELELCQDGTGGHIPSGWTSDLSGWGGVVKFPSDLTPSFDTSANTCTTFNLRATIATGTPYVKGTWLEF